MMSTRAARAGLFTAVFALVVAADQLTKWAARSFLSDGSSVTLLTGVLDLRLVYNEGAAFSLAQGWTWLFVVIATALCSLCLWAVLAHKLDAPVVALLGVAAGGGVGNLIDRVALGHVTDFLMPTFVRFPVFNVADICITCAFVALFVIYWVHDSRRQEVAEHE